MKSVFWCSDIQVFRCSGVLIFFMESDAATLAAKRVSDRLHFGPAPTRTRVRVNGEIASLLFAQRSIDQVYYRKVPRTSTEDISPK